MTLATFWFIAIAVLWTGFLVLEGFDFGVGMLQGPVGRDEPGRQAAVATIWPVWDGNEVWLIVAVAGTFAAFPGWYATMFSAFYPFFLLMLVALALRGVSFEFRGKRDSAGWRRAWDIAMTTGSLLIPLLVGIVLGNLLHGVPIGADQEYSGGFGDLFNAYSLFTGLTVVLVCLLHGAAFLALKTADDVHERAVHSARRLAPVTAAAVLGFVIWTHVSAGKGFFPSLPEIAAVLAVAAAAWLVSEGRAGAAFAATSFVAAAVVVSIFNALYPRVMVSSMGAANDLTVASTSSSQYTLRLMTIVAVVLLPVVLGYQVWTYRVFRHRIGGSGRPVTPGGKLPRPGVPTGAGTRDGRRRQAPPG